MGLNTDLELTGNYLSSTLTAFFIAYLIAKVPSSEYIIGKQDLIGSN
jgi:hypothetical protein